MYPGPNHMRDRHGNNPDLRPDQRMPLSSYYESRRSGRHGDYREKQRQEARALREKGRFPQPTVVVPEEPRTPAMFQMVKRPQPEHPIARILGSFDSFTKSDQNLDLMGVDQQPGTPAPAANHHDGRQQKSDVRSSHRQANGPLPDRGNSSHFRVPMDKQPPNAHVAPSTTSHESKPPPAQKPKPTLLIDDAKLTMIFDEMADLKAPMSALHETPIRDGQTAFEFPTLSKKGVKTGKPPTKNQSTSEPLQNYHCDLSDDSDLETGSLTPKAAENAKVRLASTNSQNSDDTSNSEDSSCTDSEDSSSNSSEEEKSTRPEPSRMPPSPVSADPITMSWSLDKIFNQQNGNSAKDEAYREQETMHKSYDGQYDSLSRSPHQTDLAPPIITKEPTSIGRRLTDSSDESALDSSINSTKRRDSGRIASNYLISASKSPSLSDSEVESDPLPVTKLKIPNAPEPPKESPYRKSSSLPNKSSSSKSRERSSKRSYSAKEKVGKKTIKSIETIPSDMESNSDDDIEAAKYRRDEKNKSSSSSHRSSRKAEEKTDRSSRHSKKADISPPAAREHRHSKLTVMSPSLARESRHSKPADASPLPTRESRHSKVNDGQSPSRESRHSKKNIVSTPPTVRQSRHSKTTDMSPPPARESRHAKSTDITPSPHRESRRSSKYSDIQRENDSRSHSRRSHHHASETTHTDRSSKKSAHESRSSKRCASPLFCYSINLRLEVPKLDVFYSDEPSAVIFIPLELVENVPSDKSSITKVNVNQEVIEMRTSPSNEDAKKLRAIISIYNREKKRPSSQESDRSKKNPNREDSQPNKQHEFTKAEDKKEKAGSRTSTPQPEIPHRHSSSRHRVAKESVVKDKPKDKEPKEDKKRRRKMSEETESPKKRIKTDAAIETSHEPAEHKSRSEKKDAYRSYVKDPNSPPSQRFSLRTKESSRSSSCTASHNVDLQEFTSAERNSDDDSCFRTPQQVQSYGYKENNSKRPKLEDRMSTLKVAPSTSITSSHNPNELSKSDSEALPNPSYISYLEKRVPVVATDHGQYLSKAKELKHLADKESNRALQVMIYLESGLYFILTGESMEQETLNVSAAFSMYNDTLKFIRHVSSIIVRKDSFKDDPSHNNLNLKLAVLSLRCQSLLYLKLYTIHAGEANEVQKDLAEYFKTASKTPTVSMAWNQAMAGASSTSTTTAGGRMANSPSSLSPTPSPAGSVGSEGSQSSSGYGTEGACQRVAAGVMSATPPMVQTNSGHLVPKHTFVSLQRHLSIANFLVAAHQNWKDSDNYIYEYNTRDFFIGMDHELGPLTLHSTASELVMYVQKSLDKLKSQLSLGGSTSLA